MGLINLFKSLKLNPYKMSENDLIKFHFSLKNEFLDILEHFNILFYGFGCKQSLLQQLFPKAKIFNCKFYKLNQIMRELQLDGTTEQNTMYDLNEELKTNGGSILFIFINFDFKWTELIGLKSIKIIATIENIQFDFTKNDIKSFNFILRDLTTYENYTEEAMDIDLFNSKKLNTLMIYKNVPTKSKIVFANLLSLGSCDLNDIFEKIKRKLMINKKKVVIEYLNEFIDHKIVSVKEETQIIINLNKNDITSLLKESEINMNVEKSMKNETE
ncbi:origin recognition complex subfamily 2 [Nucleospora cyclopteri]